jgi:hypothetical protein
MNIRVRDGLKLTPKGLLVHVGRFFGHAPSYLEIGGLLHVHPELILEAIVRGKGPNEAAFDLIYQAFRRDVLPLFPAHLPQLRADAQRYQYWQLAQGGHDGVPTHTMPFLRWLLPVEVELLLPLSALPKNLPSADRRNASKFALIEKKAVDFSLLRILAADMAAVADRLEAVEASVQAKLHSTVIPHIGFIIRAADLAERLDLIVREDLAPVTSKTDKKYGVVSRELAEKFFKLRQQTLITLASSPAIFDGETLDAMRRAVDDGLKLIDDQDNRADAIFRKLAPYRDLPYYAEEWAYFESSLLRLGTRLIRTHVEKEIIEKHVLGVMSLYASRSVRENLLRNLPEDWTRIIENEWSSGFSEVHAMRKSIFSKFIWYFDVAAPSAGSIVGRATGPSSLALAFIDASTAALARYFAANGPEISNLLGSHSFKTAMTMNRASLFAIACARGIQMVQPEAYDEIILKCVEGKFDELKDFSKKYRSLSSAAWSGLLFLINVCIIWRRVAKDWFDEQPIDVTIGYLAQLNYEGLTFGAAAADLVGNIKYFERFARISGNVAQNCAYLAGLLAILIASASVLDSGYKLGVTGEKFTLAITGSLLNNIGTIAISAEWLWANLMVETLAVEVAGVSSFASIPMIGVVVAIAGLTFILVDHAIHAPHGTTKYLKGAMTYFRESPTGRVLLRHDGDAEFRKLFVECEAFVEANADWIWSLDSNTGAASSPEHGPWFWQMFGEKMCMLLFDNDENWLQRWLVKNRS